MNSNEPTRFSRLGIRAHDIGRFSPDELACRVAAEGLDCVQLALGKAIAGIEIGLGVVQSNLATSIGNSFAKHGVGIEVLGCYINPIHPDEMQRVMMLDLFKEHLRHARGFGCSIVALESGSMNSDYSPHRDNQGEAAFQLLLANLNELVCEAEQYGVVVGIEAVTDHVISNPVRMKRLLDAIPSPHLKVVYDAVNLLSVGNCMNQHEIMGCSLDLFGDRIAVVHLKDFRVTDGRLEVCPAGLGMLDFDRLFSGLSDLVSPVSMMLEETTGGHIPSSVGFIRNFNFSSFS